MITVRLGLAGGRSARSFSGTWLSIAGLMIAPKGDCMESLVRPGIWHGQRVIVEAANLFRILALIDLDSVVFVVFFVVEVVF